MTVNNVWLIELLAIICIVLADPSGTAVLIILSDDPLPIVKYVACTLDILFCPSTGPPAGLALLQRRAQRLREGP